MTSLGGSPPREGRARAHEGRPAGVTFVRRTIRQIGEQLAELGRLPSEWERLEADTAALVRAAKQAVLSDDIALIAHSLERRKSGAEEWLRAAAAETASLVETSPEGLENEPHIITTNLTVNLKDTVMPAREVVGSGRRCPPPLLHPCRRACRDDGARV